MKVPFVKQCTWLFALPAQHVEQGLCNGAVSVRLSVCLYHSPATATDPAPQQHGAAARRAAANACWPVVPRLHLTQEAKHRLVVDVGTQE